jgi:formylmethanofuran dehydrogenase subunit B
LAEIAVISLDPPAAQQDWVPAVRFTTAIYGVHRAGTAYRMDEVPIPLRAVLSSELPSDEEVLQAIGASVGEAHANQ